MDVAEARAATGAQGLAVLASLPEYATADALRLGADLRAAGLAADVVAAAMTQSRLRSRARAKFGAFAEGMLFTPEGLEQATRLVVAGLHARRYVEAGISRVADLTAGIGADAMAMSALGLSVMAFETDEATALIADYNLRHWPDTVVVHADSLDTVRDVDVEGIYADPGRRSHGARRHDPRDYEPPLDSVLDLLDAYPALGVKVGPGIPHAAIPVDAEAEWVSIDGDVVEAGLWWGPLSAGAGRAALVLAEGSAHRLTDTGAAPQVGPIGAWLYEPDGAVIRAGLVAALAAEVGGYLLDRTIAYVTAPEPHPTPFATGYRVLDDLPFGVKPLRAYLRARAIGRLTIKKRGTAVTPEALRAALNLRGDGEATIVLTRIAGAQRVLVVEAT